MGIERWYGLTLYELLRRQSEEYGDRPAFARREGREIETFSYRRCFEDTARLASRFMSEGLGGRRIAVAAHSSYIAHIAVFAAISAGCEIAVLNFELADDMLREALRTLAPTAFIYGEDENETLERLSNGCSVKLREDELDALLRGMRESGQAPACAPKGGRGALILATSGSTGKNKLAVLRDSAFRPYTEIRRERAMLLFPLHHVAYFMFLSAAMAGGSCICLSDMRGAVRDIEIFEPDFIASVPSVLFGLAKRHSLGRLSLSGLQAAASIGAPIDMKTADYFEALGAKVMNVYGATETGVISAETPECRRRGSAGRAVNGCAIRIDGDGEILTRTQTAMEGYLGGEEPSEDGGWYRTGDLGRLDGDGFLFVTGRKKNIIILSNGENICPEEIEAMLRRCGLESEALAHAEGDVIAADIWLGASEKETESSAREAVDRYNSLVPTYYRIRRVNFLENPLPHTATGKLIRPPLADGSKK